MTVFFATALVLLFYICAVPVKFALMLRLGSRSGFGAGVSIFESRFALKGAHMRALGEKKHLSWRRKAREPEKKPPLPAFLRIGRFLLRHARLEQLRAEGCIGLGDAAQTAILCGCLNALDAALAGPLPGRVRLNLQPDFSSMHGSACISGIFSVHAGHIISAALIGAWHYLTGRILHGKASD